MEVLITLDCSKCLKNIVELLIAFQQIGWGIYNAKGKIEFLPLGDKDDYAWQCEEMSKRQLYDIVLEKIAHKEMVGINLFHQNGIDGISLLAHNTNEIMLNIAINRRIIAEKHTDIIWYLDNIIYKFFSIGINITSYKIEEFED